MARSLKRFTRHQMRFIIWCFCLCLSPKHAAAINPLANDSLSAQKIGAYDFHRHQMLGRVSSNVDQQLFVIDKDSIRALSVNELSELLQRGTPFMPLRQGFLGQWDGVDICGVLPDAQIVTHNGLPVNTITSGAYSPLTFSAGYIERLEILTGTDAIGSLPSAALVGINLQKRMFNSSRPYTSMTYFQGAGDLVGGGVTFAQNLTRSNSVAANIRRSGARGVYQQTDYDSWNVHLQDRIVLDSSNLLLGTYDIFTSDVDPWGGVSEDPFNGSVLVETIPSKNIYSREVTRRHDLALQHSYHNRDAGSLNIVSSMYATSQALRRADTVWRALHSGVTSSFSWSPSLLQLNGGVKYEYQNSDIAYRELDVSPMNLAGWVKAAYELSSGFFVASSLRFDNGASNTLGYGIALSFRDSSLTCKLDLSRIDNMTTNSQTQLIYGVTRYTLQGIPIQAVGYHYDGALSSTGAVVSAIHRIGTWDVSGSIRAMSRSDSLIRGSSYFISAQVAYVYATSASTLWFGIDGGLLGSDALPQFDVYERSYTRLPLVAGSDQNTGLSLFARVLVGTASIRASLNNILGTRWYTVAYMPDIPRQFRLTLDWTFVD